MSVDWFDPVNQPVYTVPVKIFQCPSTPAPNRTTSGTGTPSATTASSIKTPVAWSGAASWDYINTAALLAVLRMDPSIITYPAGWDPNATPANFLPSRGIIAVDTVTFAAITDGTSNTMMVSEDAGLPNQYALGRQVSPTTFSSPAAALAQAAWASDGKAWSLDGFDPATGLTNSYFARRLAGMVGVNGTNDQELYAFHTGGVNVLMGDGSVRFVSASASLRTLSALITRAGEEVVGDF